MLKRLIGLAAMAIFFSMAAQAHAVGFEVAIGGWQQSFGGSLGYQIEDNDDILDIDSELDFDDETKFMGRIKVDFPLAIPNIYVMASPIQFKGTGSKSVEVTYGDLTAAEDADLNAEIEINQYDVALYWGLPFLETATAGTFNIDLGLNVRFIDLEAKLSASATTAPGSPSGEESVSVTAPIPMLYVGFQIVPVEAFAIELEGRGLAVGDNSLFSFIGRLRYKFAGPVFVAGGYRVDTLEINTDDVEADIDFRGPFLEFGLKF